ncbi:MAG TPA: terminase family protein [Rhizomicrobium sp.]|nr:terminase family protein [Rhizomicrobium sp.]
MQEKHWNASSISSLPRADRTTILNALSNDEARLLLGGWEFWARDEQRAPPGDWRIWLLMGGRGSGKTRAGAEWIADGIRERKMNRVALIAATHHEARTIMIEGQSGLLSVSEGAAYEPSLRRVTWPSGAVAHVLSADEPDSIRGHQFDGAWCDEFAKWSEPQAALDMILMALRLGEDPRMVVTTTPRNIAAVRDLIANEDVKVETMSTRDNAANLAKSYLRQMERRYAGTRLGRQEIDGDLIEDNENALWQRDWIERHRLRTVPPLSSVVVAIDPPVGLHGDECGIVVAGIDADGQGHVLADRSRGKLTPVQWAAHAIDAFEEFQADRIVAEANQGGEMIRAMLTRELSTAPVKMVHALRDKRTRAAPIAALYERGLVHHIGALPELEDQMCQYDGTGKSPDRMDALVWALTELFPLERRAEPNIRVIGD